jgi:hypothetical protein
MTDIAAARERREPLVTHIYSLPVVRELPSQPPDAAQNHTW